MDQLGRQRVRVKALFEAARGLPPSEREAFLEVGCGEDTALRAAVVALLQALDEAGAFLQGPTVVPPAAPPLEGKTAPDLTEGPGARIGPYKLLQQIGEGGFGAVFMAEQERPVRRRVAVKIIKLGMDTKQVIARFEAERQALAMMDHPNIARVLDAGATDTGRPYFVMELVKGEPITAYCDRNTLGLPERLSLLAQVCHAVQHAHTKGIIHRDIKPSNVLVSTQDGRPLAKIIDFGIAKATDHRLTERTLFTEHRALIGTPEYMSPEQAEGSLDIDTRTDIYSLGVLLYELLTGATPFDSASLRSAAFNEVQRIIREVEPARPSLRLSQSGEQLASLAAHRRTEPRRLGGLVRGELDWIVMKCLDKDRTRRYETASALAADVARHLAGEAIVAAPPSAGYRARKFVRKHRGPVIAATAVLAVLTGGIIGTASGYAAARRREADQSIARQAEAEARQRAEDAKHDALAEKAAAEQARAREVTARQAETGAKEEAIRLRDAAQSEAYAANIMAADAALRAGEAGAVRARLDACDRERRGWEWRLLDAQSDQSLLVLRGHEKGVNSAAFSPDGRWIVTASDDHTARVWDAQTGAELHRLTDHQDEVWWASVSPDGRRAVTASKDGTARVWDTAIWQTVATLRHDAGTGVNSAWFSPEGSRVLTATDGSLVVWSAATGERERPLVPDVLGGVLYSGASSPDGRWIAIATGMNSPARASVQLMYAETGVPLPLRLDGQVADSEAVRFSADGRRLAAGFDDGTALVWDTDSGKVVFHLGGHDGHQESVGALDFSPDGARIATGSFDKTIRLWDARSGALLGVLRGHADWISSVAFSPDGRRIVSASPDGTARVWDAAAPPPDKLRGHEGPITSACFSPDGAQLVTASADKTARVWDMATGTTILTLRGHEGQVATAQFNDDGSRVLTASSEDHTARLWDAVTGREVALLRADAPIQSACFGPDGTRVLTTGGGTAELWDAQGQRIRAFVGVYNAVFNAAGDRIIAQSLGDPGIRAWEVRTGREIPVGTLPAVANIGAITSGWPEFTADYTSWGGPPPMILTRNDTNVQAWDAASGSLRFTLAAPGAALCVSIAEDGGGLVTGSQDYTARLWDASTGAPRGELRGHEGAVQAAWFGPGNQRVFTLADDRTLRVWDPASVKELLVLRELGRDPWVVASPDGGRLVTWDRSAKGNDWAARIWDTVPYRDRLGGVAAHAEMRRRIAAIVDGQLGAAAPGGEGQVEAAILADASLSLYERQAAVAILRERLADQRKQAQSAFDALCAKHLTKARVLAAVRDAADDQLPFPPAMRGPVRDLAEAWTPTSEELAEAAWEVVTQGASGGTSADPADYAAAVEAAREAVALDPDSSDAAVTLGAALYRAGQFEEAVTVLTRIDDDEPCTLACLAMSLHLAGKVDQARKTMVQLWRVMASADYEEDEDEAAEFLEEAEEVLGWDGK